MDRLEAHTTLLDKGFTEAAQWLSPMFVDDTLSHFKYEWPSYEIMKRAYMSENLVSKQFSFRMQPLRPELGRLYERIMKDTLIDSILQGPLPLYSLKRGEPLLMLNWLPNIH